jgi:cytochrome c oxidase subunit II
MRTPRRPLTRPLIGTTLMLLLLLLVGCAGPEARQTTVITNGDHAQRILELLVPISWMALAVFVVVEGILLYTVWRFRRRSNAIPAQIHGNTRIEILWTIAPALIVLVIAVLTFRTQAATAQLTLNPSADTVEITAVGHQWWFEFRYPGAGAEGKDLSTASDLYIPVGRPVRITLQSEDVMHNFWVPRLAGKTYMIPGKTNYLAFTALEPGIYRAVCAEFCGEAHALMRFRVVAVPEDQFQSWLTQRAVTPAAPASTITVNGLTGDAARGAALFVNPAKQCITCHAVEGTAAQGVIGPNLTYYGSRQIIAAGILPYSPENLSKWLHEAPQLKPGNIMSRVITPQWIQANLSDQDIADLTAYLDSMKVSVNLPPEK